MFVDMWKDIEKFHEKFGFSRRKAGEKPSKKLVNFRLKFLQEEVQELNVAFGKNDLADVLDGLVDIVYVALGTAWQLGLPYERAWKLVQEANMKKIKVTSASQSQRGYVGDVIKPDGWTPPDIIRCLDVADASMRIKSPKPGETGHQLDLIDYIKVLNKGEK